MYNSNTTYISIYYIVHIINLFYILFFIACIKMSSNLYDLTNNKYIEFKLYSSE